MIPLVDLTRQYKTLHVKIEKAFTRIMKQGDYILGNDVALFEQEFARYTDTRYAVGTASGTDAILLALRALQIGPGDDVIVPANTFISTVLPIIYLGANPILVDIDPKTYSIDVHKIEKTITQKTKVILPVHLYGRIADMDAIDAIAKKHTLFIIEDACQAHGASYKGKQAGSFGDVGCFSFYPGKNLGAYGDGGAITTNKKTIARTIHMLRNIGQKKKYHHDVLGYNSRLDSLQAAVLRVKLPYLDQWNRQRKKHARTYTRLLQELDVSPPYIDADSVSNYHLYVVRVKKRDKLLAYLKKHNIFCGIHYPIPLHLQPSLARLGYTKGDFPETEKAAGEIISLPMFPELTEKEIRTVVAKIREFYYHSRT